MTLTYYRISFRLASSLSVGSGENAKTDSDIILDSSSKPIIPAAAFAGTIRHYNDIGYNDKNDLFGYIDSENSKGSRIRFFDAVPVSDPFITVFDNVKLENKVGVHGAKFDREAVEANAEYITHFELTDASEQEKQLILSSFAAFNMGHLRIGSKTSRGYGQIFITQLQTAEFDMPADKEKWLDFDPYDYTSDKYYSLSEIKSSDIRYNTIRIKLQQKGAVSIRSYTVKDPKDISSADYIQLSDHDGVPIIPGTSWAGAFRSRFAEFGGKDLTDSLFGYVDEKNKRQKKSDILFSESRLSGGTGKVITRNSIDRFSAATKKGALYSEKTYYNGSCQLDISIKKGIEDEERCLKILCAVLCDLDRGHLAVGGLTSVGRGLFGIEELFINDIDKTGALKAADISEMTGGIL
ncbi:MAG: RAMP superfamily CRISPR-associated protein [Oscillospiraceae bacterium]